MDCFENFKTVAGDDFTLAVEFQPEDGENMPESYSSELILHHMDGVERIYPAVRYDGNTAFFHVSGEETAMLLSENPCGSYQICVRICFPDGSHQTPVHRVPFFVKEC